MVCVEVCVSSNCHIKGSYFVLNRFRELTKKNQLGSMVELKASFCFGCCKNGATIRVNGELISGVTPQNCDQIYQTYIQNKAGLQDGRRSEGVGI